MNKLFLTVILYVFFVAPVFAYDKGLAKNFEHYFNSFSVGDTGKAMQFISAEALVEGQKKGDNLFMLDVRTPGETSIYGFNMANSMAIPMNKVFNPENLKKIPTTLKVVVVCKSGTRAIAVATGLRIIGFKSIFVLKNGFSALADYHSPKSAY